MSKFQNLIGRLWLGIALAAISGWFSTPAIAQTSDVSVAANTLYLEAVDLQKMAAELGNSEGARSDYNQAIAKCDVATRSLPDFFKAQALAAHCYYRLAQIQSPQDSHPDLVKAARDRFALAALCTGTEVDLYCEWGGMLVGEAKAMPQLADRIQLLRDARRVYEAGLSPVNVNGERAKVERDLGICLMILAKDAVDDEDQKALFEEAITRFTSAAKVGAVANTPELFTNWGAALIEDSKLTNNRMLLRQAVERLESALEKGADGAELLDDHYNLCRAYALLGQLDQAMENLRFCLNHDTDKHTYFAAAAGDPDLRSLEQVPEYNQIFSEKAGFSIGTIVKPELSDK